MAEIEINKQDNETKNTGNQSGNVSQSGSSGNKSNQPGSDIGDKVSSAVTGDTQAAKDLASKAVNQAKETAGDVAGKVYNKATQTASTLVDQQKSNLANDLSKIAESILQFGSNLRGEDQAHGIAGTSADYVTTIADNIEQASKYLNNNDLGDMLDDVKVLAHRNPPLFIGGAFVLGLLAARFLKSSKSNQSSGRNHLRYQRKGKYLPDESEGIHLPENLDEQVRTSSNRNESRTDSASNTGENKSANAASQNKGV